MRHNQINSALRSHRFLTQRSFRNVAAVMLLGLLSFSSAVGQTSAYSDSWLDDSNAENGTVYVVGCGITIDDYNTYGHDYGVDTMITSPNGSTAFASGGAGGFGYNYARAEAALLYQFTEEGTFYISSTHTTVCPYYDMESNPGESFSELGLVNDYYGSNDVYFGFYGSSPVGSPPRYYCFYEACGPGINNTNPPNNCFFHTLIDEQALHGGTCPVGFRNTYQRVRIPLIPFLSRCIRIAHVALSGYPC